MTCNNFHRDPIIPRRNKGQKMNKNVKFMHSLKVKPRFLILLINLKTGATQWGVGVGRQRGTKLREAGERGTRSGRLWTPCLPPLAWGAWLAWCACLAYLRCLALHFQRFQLSSFGPAPPISLNNVPFLSVIFPWQRKILYSLQKWPF